MHSLRRVSNICPVYREIGGHAYGSTYSGPIGSVISLMLAIEASEPEKLPYASSLCGACRDACPVMIDLPRLLLTCATTTCSRARRLG